MIEKAAEKGEVDFLPLADMEMLFRETVRWMLRLTADDENKKYIANLKKLLDKIMEEQAASEPPPEPMVPPIPGGIPSVNPAMMGAGPAPMIQGGNPIG
ncbi:hypothetical protein CCP3SC15_5610001 [Gammaproteobacteria bacterium]